MLVSPPSYTLKLLSYLICRQEVFLVCPVLCVFVGLTYQFVAIVSKMYFVLATKERLVRNIYRATIMIHCFDLSLSELRLSLLYYYVTLMIVLCQG